MKSKKDLVIKLVNEGKYEEALKIAKDFKRDFNKDDSSIIRRAHEMQKNESFYKQLGFCKKDQFKKAVIILNKFAMAN